jgi:PEGA domain-containing protein
MGGAGVNGAYPLGAALLCLALGLLICPGDAGAGHSSTGRGRFGAGIRNSRGGPACVGKSSHGLGAAPGGGAPDEGLLVVDAVPASAQVFLDGRLLGSAGDLLARALPLEAGRHLVQILAPSFKPWVARVTADPPYSTRLQVSLARE